jgi:thiamine pyrophosphate-dependent acetolactate synthase large subunit-like protein
LKAAVAEAFAIDGPAIVDAVVVSNELPNLPHLKGCRPTRNGQ